MTIVEIVIAVASVLSVFFFLLYVYALLRLPGGRRPKTPTFDRFGDPLPPSVNPGFGETEEERSPP
ncbi:MAG TPA: hypothetical protein VFB58_03285 [Chloroflexota bacterium]|nr:hypothetical protein [Chloroflexota bacterium]